MRFSEPSQFHTPVYRVLVWLLQKSEHGSLLREEWHEWVVVPHVVMFTIQLMPPFLLTNPKSAIWRTGGYCLTFSECLLASENVDADALAHTRTLPIVGGESV